MLLGLIRPTAGSIELFGRDPLYQGAHALDGVAGFVEAPALLSVPERRRNLRLLADYDEPRTRNRIEEVLDLVELGDRGNDRVGGYSHGMKQRLGIAAVAAALAAAAASGRADHGPRPGRHAGHAPARPPALG